MLVDLERHDLAWRRELRPELEGLRLGALGKLRALIPEEKSR